MTVKSSLTVSQFNNHLKSLQLDIIDNSNINSQGLDSSGLHLNNIGTSKLAMNFD